MQQDTKGLFLAISAYTMWGFFPLYFHYLESVFAIEVLAQRIIWSLVVTLSIGLMLGYKKRLLAAFKNTKLLAWLGVSALLISINWLVYIWAVSQHHVLESSLGYFITPVVSLLLARLFFKEKLHKLQVLAGLIACIAIIWEVVVLGQLPWISIVLALAFALYGVVRKHCEIDGINGMTVETLWLLLPAIGWLIWQANSTSSPQPLSFGSNQSITFLLIGVGLVSAFPLLLFAMATRRTDLSIVGFIMYINPTMQFLIGVFILKEDYPAERMVTFAIIWLAMCLFSIGLYQQRKDIN